MAHALRYAESRARSYLRFGILSSTMVITIVVAVLAFFQGVAQFELDRMTHQIDEMSERITQTKGFADQALQELEDQRDRLPDLDALPDAGTNQRVELMQPSFRAQLASLETDVAAIKSSNVVGKVAQIESILKGDVMRLLSVPLLRSQLDSYRALAERDMDTLGEGIERVATRD